MSTNIAGCPEGNPCAAKVCGCVGIQYSGYTIPDAGGRYYCAGIPHSCECYTYNIGSDGTVKTETKC